MKRKVLFWLAAAPWLGLIAWGVVKGAIDISTGISHTIRYAREPWWEAAKIGFMVWAFVGGAYIIFKHFFIPTHWPPRPPS